MASERIENSDESVIKELLGTQFVSSTQVLGGGNSRIWKVIRKDASPVAVKFYFTHASDTRDRLGTEFDSSEFLWNAGVRNIPQPLERSNKFNVGIYQFIEGVRIKPEEITLSDLEVAFSFAETLKNLSGSSKATELSGASEASFTLEELVTNLTARLGKIEAVSEALFPVHKRFESLRTALVKEIFPKLVAKAKSVSHAALPLSARTLSPSDFGFHNAIKGADGSWTFHDFEYFGWDDPVKLISDFILHPAMNLSPAMAGHFRAKGEKFFTQFDSNLAARLTTFFPLYTLKWCCILLNEFVPEFRMRRRFAKEQSPAELEASLERQLGKVETLIGRWIAV